LVHLQRPHRLPLMDTSPTELYPLSLHDALPISPPAPRAAVDTTTPAQRLAAVDAIAGADDTELSVQPLRDAQVDDLRQTAIAQRDRKSTRLNSSHVKISYAVFCLKKKKTENNDL